MFAFNKKKKIIKRYMFLGLMAFSLIQTNSPFSLLFISFFCATSSCFLKIYINGKYSRYGCNIPYHHFIRKNDPLPWLYRHSNLNPHIAYY